MKTYLIYDGQNSVVFSEDVLIDAKNSKEAIEKHLANTGRKHIKIRFGHEPVIFCATPVKIGENSNLYLDGVKRWYSIKY